MILHVLVMNHSYTTRMRPTLVSCTNISCAVVALFFFSVVRVALFSVNAMVYLQNNKAMPLADRSHNFKSFIISSMLNDFLVILLPLYIGMRYPLDRHYIHCFRIFQSNQQGFVH